MRDCSLLSKPCKNPNQFCAHQNLIKKYDKNLYKNNLKTIHNTKKEKSSSKTTKEKNFCMTRLGQNEECYSIEYNKGVVFEYKKKNRGGDKRKLRLFLKGGVLQDDECGEGLYCGLQNKCIETQNALTLPIIEKLKPTPTPLPDPQRQPSIVPAQDSNTDTDQQTMIIVTTFSIILFFLVIIVIIFVFIKQHNRKNSVRQSPSISPPTPSSLQPHKLIEDAEKGSVVDKGGVTGGENNKEIADQTTEFETATEINRYSLPVAMNNRVGLSGEISGSSPKPLLPGHVADKGIKDDDVKSAVTVIMVDDDDGVDEGCDVEEFFEVRKDFVDREEEDGELSRSGCDVVNDDEENSKSSGQITPPKFYASYFNAGGVGSGLGLPKLSSTIISSSKLAKDFVDDDDEESLNERGNEDSTFDEILKKLKERNYKRYGKKVDEKNLRPLFMVEEVKKNEGSSGRSTSYGFEKNR